MRGGQAAPPQHSTVRQKMTQFRWHTSRFQATWSVRERWRIISRASGAVRASELRSELQEPPPLVVGRAERDELKLKVEVNKMEQRRRQAEWIRVAQHSLRFKALCARF